MEGSAYQCTSNICFGFGCNNVVFKVSLLINGYLIPPCFVVTSECYGESILGCKTGIVDLYTHCFSHTQNNASHEVGPKLVTLTDSLVFAK